MNSYTWADSCYSDIAFDWEGNHFIVGGKNNSSYIYRVRWDPIFLGLYCVPHTLPSLSPHNNRLARNCPL